MCRTLISGVKPQHSWAGYPPNGAFFLSIVPPVPSNTAQGDACPPLSHCSWSNNLLLPKDVLWSPFHQENCHCPTHATENMPDNVRSSETASRLKAGSLQQPGIWPWILRGFFSPSSFHGCNWVIPLCKSGINMLTLLRLFCSLNAVWIIFTYACVQSRIINLWKQQLTPRPTAKIPADGTKAGPA